MKAQEFLRVSGEFRLGHLPTERPHPLTAELSHWAQHDLPLAWQRLLEVDQGALTLFGQDLSVVDEMAASWAEVLSTGGRIFLSGCGATGRLSLVLEKIWREDCRDYKHLAWQDKVISFMAGGDVALIRSIENFEDHPHFGARQLRELGFTQNDLLIASTEGGETPFVIGATLAAKNISKHPPYFLFCNPSALLATSVLRSREILLDKNIKARSLYVGPMALSGSTRMQASSILMLAIGLAMLKVQRPETSALAFLAQLKRALNYSSQLCVFVEREAQLYQQKKRLLYRCDSELAISVLTDTTERSPTFGLPVFENEQDLMPSPAWCFLKMPGTLHAGSAWRQLLGRAPRALAWTEYQGLVEEERLYGYNISESKGASSDIPFDLDWSEETLRWRLNNLTHTFYLGPCPRLMRHMVLKMFLNSHSTLVMGRLGRYRGNWMTFVKASNNKLVDRAIRYAQGILREKKKEVSYEELAIATFELQEKFPDEAVVLKLVEKFS